MDTFKKILKFYFSSSGIGLNCLVVICFLILFSMLGSDPINSVFYKQYDNDTKLLDSNIALLVPIETIQINQIDISVHNRNLLSTLQERESSHEYSIESQVESQRQTRNIYIIIMGVILAVVLRMFGDKNEKNFIKKIIITIFLAFLVILFYSLDVNQEDLLMRSNKAKSITSVTLDSLINQNPKNNTWYKIDYSERKTLLRALEKSSLQRKIYTMFQSPSPNLNPNHSVNPIQFVIYIIPLFLVYISFLIILYNKNNTSKRSKGQAI